MLTLKAPFVKIMSDTINVWSLSKQEISGQVYSETLSRPKNANVEAAQNNALL